MSKIFCVLTVVLLLTSCTTKANEQGISSSQGIKESPITEIEEAPEPLMQCIYYEHDMFTKAVSAPKKYTVEGELIGGMIPHHLLVADMMAGFIKMAAEQKQNYETVLIVSPSHFPENCTSDAVTSSSDWDTPFGVLKTDKEFTDALLKNKVINAENSYKNVEYDHGAAGIIPFVKYYLPEVKVAVCLLSNRLSEERLAEVQKFINEQTKDKNILVIASADCSHYLQPEQAAEHDKETAKAIENFDLPRIMRFTDSNVDSPQSVTTFLSAIKAKDGKLIQLDHAASKDKLPHAANNPIYDEGITTYYVYGGVK